MSKHTETGTRASEEPVRAELMERYAEVFGCDWDLAPWGRRWPEILAEANAADRDYKRARDLLEDLASAIDAVTEYARSCGAGNDVSDDVMFGRTRPEQAAFVLSCAETQEGASLNHVRETLRKMLGVVSALEAPPAEMLPVDLLRKAATVHSSVEASNFEEAISNLVELFRAQGEHQFELMRALESLPEDVEEGLEVEPPALPEGSEARAAIDSYRRLFATHATRRLWPMRVRLPHLPEFLAPPMSLVELGPLPRTLEVDPPKGSEWRRAYLVQLLDTYPLKSGGALGVRATSDEDIAVVSLLSGGLSDVAASVIAGGADAVLKAEEKAVAQARGRRGVVSRRLESEGLGTLGRAAKPASRPRKPL